MIELASSTSVEERLRRAVDTWSRSAARPKCSSSASVRKIWLGGEPVASARRGEVWSTDAGITVLVISSTVYNEVPSEPTVVVVPAFDTGFGVDLGEGWAAPGLVASLRKVRLRELRRRIDLQALTDVNNILFKILATPDR